MCPVCPGAKSFGRERRAARKLSARLPTPQPTDSLYLFETSNSSALWCVRREEDRYDKEIDILGKGGCGLVLVKDKTGCIYVWMQQKGGPAHRSKQIESGDLLQHIQDIDDEGNLVKGQAKLSGLEGTAVQLTFKRGFHSADVWSVRLRRMKGCDDELALAAPGFEFPSMGPAPVSEIVSTAPPPPDIVGNISHLMVGVFSIESPTLQLPSRFCLARP